MDVAGCDYRLFKLLAKPYHRFVKLSYLIFVLDYTLVDEEHVVGNRLYFKIIVIFRYTKQLSPRPAELYSVVKLARLAGTAKEKPIAVLIKQRLWYKRLFIKIVKMRCRNKLV